MKARQIRQNGEEWVSVNDLRAADAPRPPSPPDLILSTLFDTSRWLDAGATFSPCGAYRYRLWRTWDEIAPTVGFTMLNPSTADAAKDDATIKRCLGFARSWGYGGLVVVNLFALRSTDPAALYTHADPVGPDNDGHIDQVRASVPMMIAAWGAHGALRGRGAKVLDTLDMRHLGLTKDGHPRHPLYLRGDARPMPFSR